MSGWAYCGVKIKSKENESPFPQSQSGYKYIHIDTRILIRFSTRGWHYISWSVGGVMRGMYNSSMWDSTEGELLYPSEAPKTSLMFFLVEFDARFCVNEPEKQTWVLNQSVDVASAKWQTAQRLQHREVIKYDRKWGGRLDCHSGGAEVETWGCIKKSPRTYGRIASHIAESILLKSESHTCVLLGTLTLCWLYTI